MDQLIDWLVGYWGTPSRGIRSRGTGSLRRSDELLFAALQVAALKVAALEVAPRLPRTPDTCVHDFVATRNVRCEQLLDYLPKQCES